MVIILFVRSIFVSSTFNRECHVPNQERDARVEAHFGAFLPNKSRHRESLHLLLAQRPKRWRALDSGVVIKLKMLILHAVYNFFQYKNVPFRADESWAR